MIFDGNKKHTKITTMKYLNIVYAIGAILLILGSYLKFNDSEYGALLNLIGFSVGVTAFAFHLTYLNKRVKRLEQQQR